MGIRETEGNITDGTQTMTAKEDVTLLLFTDSYPYDSAAENSFLDPEIPHLINNFEKVIIFPKSSAGKRYQVPEEITVNLDFSKNFGKKHHKIEFGINFYYAAGSKFFYQELIKKPVLIFQFVNFYRNDYLSW